VDVGMTESYEDHGHSLICRCYPALDGWRGAPILMVFLVHYGSLFLSDAFTGGLWAGVNISLLLLGFLITAILYDSKVSLHFFRKFYVRRHTFRTRRLKLGRVITSLVLRG
jgi:hypothetical protein